MQVIYFDESGYKDTTVYIVNESNDRAKKGSNYIEKERCLYTVIKIDSTHNPNLFDVMKEKMLPWALSRNETPKGVVYLILNMGIFNNEELSYFLEIWVPLEN